MPAEPSGTTDVIELEWTLRHADGIEARFDHRGLISRLEDQNQRGLSFAWEPGTRLERWRLAFVTDSVGRTIDLQYDVAGRLDRIIEPVSGLQVEYAVDAHGDLISATDASGVVESYEYDFDATRSATTAEYLPEGTLRAACTLACSASETSCGSSGACANAGVDGLAACRTECDGCEPACIESCQAGCRDVCRNGADGMIGCTGPAVAYGSPPVVSGDGLCGLYCAGAIAGEAGEYFSVEEICDDIWTSTVSVYCMGCEGRCDDWAMTRCQNLLSPRVPRLKDTSHLAASSFIRTA